MENFQKSWDHSCVNCNRDLEFSTASNKINNINVSLRLPVQSDTFMEDISVYEALSCLFHLHLIEKSNESTKKNMFLCFSCSLTLKDLYRRYREFSLLRSSSSYLAYKIEQLEKDLLAGASSSASSMNSTVPSYTEMTSAQNLVELVLPQGGNVQQQDHNQLGLANTTDHGMETKVVQLTTQVSQASGTQQQQQHQQQHQHQVQDIIFDPNSMQLQQGLVEIVFNDNTGENAILTSNTTINDFADLVTLPGYMVELAGTGSGSPNFQKEIALVSQPMNFMMNNPPDVLLNPNPIGTSEQRKPEVVVAQKSKARAKNTNNRKKNPPGLAAAAAASETTTTAIGKKRPAPKPNNQAMGATTNASGSGTKSKKNVKRKENTAIGDGSAGPQHVNSSFQDSAKKPKTKKTTVSSASQQSQGQQQQQPHHHHQQQQQQQQAGDGTSSSSTKPLFPTVEVVRTTPEPISNYRVSSSDPPYLCPKCSKEMKDKCSYAKHVYNHSQQNKFKCPRCRLKYSKYSSLRQHCEHHHSLTPIEPPPVHELKPKQIVHLVIP